MKKSFMTRALAMGLSFAMAFSLSAATNVTTASAAAKKASVTTFMKASSKTVTEGKSVTAYMKSDVAKKYRIKSHTESDVAKKYISVKMLSSRKGLTINAKDGAVTAANLEKKGVNTKIYFAPAKSASAVKKAKATKYVNLKVAVKAVPKQEEKPDEPVVEALALTDVKQVASNSVNVSFSADASKDVTKDNLTIKSVDGAVELSVKSVEFSADGKEARVTIFGNFVNATQYNVSYNSVDKAFTASVGAVTSISVDTASAEQNVATDIKFTLKDAQGIDVTSAIDIDSHVTVTVAGSYSTLENSYASKAKITMNTVGDIADVTVTYSANQSGVENVVGTGKITCISPAAKLGTRMFKSAKDSNVNSKSNCAKFYLGLKDENVSVAVNGIDDNVYFCATNAAGDVISYDSYTVESANDNIAAAAATVASGKYARISVYGNNVGTTQLNITASKNGVDSYYTIPVIVTKTDAATKIVVSQDRKQMSTVNEAGYDCTVTVSLQDVNDKKVDSDFTAELLTEMAAGKTAPTIADATLSGTEVKFKLNFAGAEASTNTWKTYTFKITGADKNHKDATFSQNVTVQVKKLPSPLTKLEYQIELTVDGVVSNKVEETSTKKRDITAKLYATCNGLFAGYVSNLSIGTVGNTKIGNATVPTNSAITAVSGCAVRGVDVFEPSNSTAGLVSKAAFSSKEGKSLNDSEMTFKSVVNTNSNASVVDTSSEVAEVGSYNVIYGYSISGGAVKYVSAPFTVSRDYKTPTAKVSTTTVSNIYDFDKIIEEAITTNVDMNNNDSGYESITKSNGGFFKKNTVGVDKYTQLTNDDYDKATKPNGAIINKDRVVVGYVQVCDNVNTDEDWLFYAPVNATFKQK